jgi:hypothetical protein
MSVDEASERIGEIAQVKAGLIGAGEQGGLTVQGDRADRALDPVGVYLDAAVIEEASYP